MTLTKVKSGFLTAEKDKNDTWNKNHSTLFHHQLVPPTWRFQPPTGLLPLMKTRGWHGVVCCGTWGNWWPWGKIEAREPDSWARVVPPTIQLPDSICSSVLQWGLKRQHGEHIYHWLHVTLFFLDGGGRELEGWRVDWTPLMLSGVEDHRGRWVRHKCLIRWKERRSRATCMIGMKQPDSFKWVGVQGHRRPYCAAFNSPGNTPISWKITMRGCWVFSDDVFQSHIFCQITFPVPTVTANRFSLHSANDTDYKVLLNDMSDSSRVRHAAIILRKQKKP